jgi:hypothetical protein
LKKIKTSENSSLALIIENNTDNDRSMCGGPVCHFNRVEGPCFVCCTKKSGITLELLVEMLKTIDSYKLFDLSNGSLPFLLLDGHHSQTRLPFLDYVNSDEHKWMVCIRVPYATHLWEVADSSEMNGSFKIALTKTKIRSFSGQSH